MSRRNLNDDIFDRAKLKFDQSITLESVYSFEDVWIECARELKAEFEVEGLTQTAKAVQDIIDFNISTRPKPVSKKTVEDMFKIIEAEPKLKPLDENVLPDDYPMYAGYAYVVDGVATLNDLHAISVYGYKVKTGAKEVRRCDIYGRLERENKN